MELGLKLEHIVYIKKQLKNHLKAGSSIWAFGSRARGDYQQFSDLDLMLESTEDQQAEIGKLNEVFVESQLPIKIDLVQFKDFASSYRENYLKERVLFIQLESD